MTRRRTPESAFPNGGSFGMSLRDYFAGQALLGMVGDKHDGEFWGQIADTAYRAADAMMKARETEQASLMQSAGRPEAPRAVGESPTHDPWRRRASQIGEYGE